MYKYGDAKGPSFSPIIKLCNSLILKVEVSTKKLQFLNLLKRGNLILDWVKGWHTIKFRVTISTLDCIGIQFSYTHDA